MIPFSPIDQLERLLKEYPSNKDILAIEGLILDYVGQSGARIDKVFEMNLHIYNDLFTGTNVGKGRELLRSVLRSRQEGVELQEACEHQKLWDAIPILLREVLKSRDTPAKNVVDNPEAFMPNGIDAVVWQISDIHFGKYNKVEDDPKELAFMLSKVAAEYQNLVPHLIVISGDVTSTAADDEFSAFVRFCRFFSSAVWGAERPDRILVVPGNHDVSWLDSGTADRMKKFEAAVSKAKCCITPFGPKSESFDSDSVVVNRYVSADDSAPPIAEVIYKKIGLCFVLLVSGYFSGEIPQAVRTALEDPDPSEESLMDILRVDQGAVNREYLATIARLPVSELNTVAVIHHNPIQYGVEVSLNRFAPQLLETLGKKTIPLLLHGHTHLVDDAGSRRQPEKDWCYPVPCPTLCSITTAGSGRGMNLYLIGKQAGTQRHIGTILWFLSGSEGFNPDGAKLRYRFPLVEGRLKFVEHSDGLDAVDLVTRS